MNILQIHFYFSNTDKQNFATSRPGLAFMTQWVGWLVGSLSGNKYCVHVTRNMEHVLWIASESVLFTYYCHSD